MTVNWIELSCISLSFFCNIRLFCKKLSVVLCNNYVRSNDMSMNFVRFVAFEINILLVIVVTQVTSLFCSSRNKINKLFTILMQRTLWFFCFLRECKPRISHCSCKREIYPLSSKFPSCIWYASGKFSGRQKISLFTNFP